MSDKAKDILIIVAMLLAYGLVGRLDYDAQVVDSMAGHGYQTANAK